MRSLFSQQRATLNLPLTLKLLFVSLGGALPVMASGELSSVYLHGGGSGAQALFLDTVAPTAATPKFKDSAGVKFSGGNPWKEIGTWTATSPLFTGTVPGLSPLHVFVGLKNSDDEGTRFDLRAEVSTNGVPLKSGQALCLTGVTRSPDRAKEVTIIFDPAEFSGTDTLSLRLLTRIGTNGAGAFCGGHGSAVGLRLYFDAVSRPSRFASPIPAGIDWNTGVGGTPDRKSLSSAVGPSAPSILWHGGIPAVFGQQAVTENDVVVSTRTQSYGADGSLVVAQELSTGVELWRTKLPISFNDSWASHVSAIRGGQVYATRTGNGLNEEYLYALNAANGSILWKSQDLMDEESYAESLAFAANGDPIVGNFFSLTRINHLDGMTVWKTARYCGFSNGCMATVSGDHVYASDYDSGFLVGVFDVATGNRLYSSAVLPGAITNPLLAGPGAMVYGGPISSPRPDGSPALAFIALQDTGSALIEKWRIPMADTAFASFGIGPDGSVYTYSPSNQILRLDPATGAVKNTSMHIPSFGYLYGPRMAIDSAGRVFLTADAATGGAVYSFNADLTPRWSESLPDVNLGGPALGRDGTLVVCGSEVRAYKTSP